MNFKNRALSRLRAFSKKFATAKSELAQYRKRSNNPGSALMEVLIALAITGLLFSAIFGLQSTVVRSVMRITHRFDRVRLARAFLAESLAQSDVQKQDQITKDKKISYPKTELHFQKKKVEDSQLFGKYVKHMIKEAVTSSWKEGSRTYQDAYVTYRYVPKKTSKKGEVLS